MNKFYKSMKKMKKIVLYFQICKKNKHDFYKDLKLVNYIIRIFQTYGWKWKIFRPKIKEQIEIKVSITLAIINKVFKIF
jgi:hypothetical protein